MHPKMFHIPHRRIYELHGASSSRVLVCENIDRALKVLFILLLFAAVEVTSCDHG